MELLSPTLNSSFSQKNAHAHLELAIQGQYKKVIDQVVLANANALIFPKTTENVQDFAKTIENFVENSGDKRLKRELDLLTLGVCCLQLFVVTNWTGPNADVYDFTEIPLNQKNDELLALLEVDGEPVYHLIRNPILLCLAMKIFQRPDIFVHFETSYWWCLRYLSVHQQLLHERSPFLHQLSLIAIEKLKSSAFMEKLLEKSHRIQLHLEIGLLQLHYYQYKDANENFEAAHSVSGISCDLDGALGVRTKFQQKPVAQLRVQIDRKGEEIKTFTPKFSAADIPKALPLDDDTLLEAVKFIENEDGPSTKLSAEEQSVILTMCTSMQKASPAHRLRDEQIICVIESLLSDPKCWAVHCEALRVRCLLERDRSRTVERSMMQLELLVKNISSKAKGSTSSAISGAIKRLTLFYSTWSKPTWMLEKQLAALFTSLGVLSSALDIYLRLHMWEEAIVCLIRTERGHDAEKLIRDQLAIKETPNLYCLLGDILQDPSQYSKAWEISRSRNARAMRSLGAFYVSKKQFKEAVECFEKSLKVNYMQVGTWFSMGCSALANADYEKAIKSFQKCVCLNWDNFEAWTNLSTSFVRSGKKIQAYKALTEGLKCNFNRWELWENFLFISVDTGHFVDALRAYNRLVDLKDKYVDTAVLKILVRAVTEDLEDANDSPACKLRPTLLELFGRLTSKVTSNWEVWSLYAQLLGDGMSDLEDSNNKAIHYLQKALRSAIQRIGWEKDEKSATENVDLCIRLLACVRRRDEDSHTDDSTVVSTRLSVNGVKAKLQMYKKSLMKEDVIRRYEELTAELEGTLCLNSSS